MKITPGSLVQRSGQFINYVYKQSDVDTRQHPHQHAAHSPLLLQGAKSVDWKMGDFGIVLYRSDDPCANACLIMIPVIGPVWVPIRSLSICAE